MNCAAYQEPSLEEISQHFFARHVDRGRLEKNNAAA
jgi:hypothetical protein